MNGHPQWHLATIRLHSKANLTCAESIEFFDRRNANYAQDFSRHWIRRRNNISWYQRTPDANQSLVCFFEIQPSLFNRMRIANKSSIEPMLQILQMIPDIKGRYGVYFSRVPINNSLIGWVCVELVDQKWSDASVDCRTIPYKEL